MTPFWRILAAGLGTQAIAIGAGAATYGLGAVEGLFSPFRAGWIDLANNFAPLWLVLCLLGALLVAVGLEARPARRNLLLLAALGSLICGGPVVVEGLERFELAFARKAAGPSLRILDFNAFDENFDTKQAIQEILRVDADIVTLQELREIGPLLPQLRRVYPHQVMCLGLCSAAILSKRPPLATEVRTLSGARLGWVKAPGDGDLDVVRAVIPVADGPPVTVVTTHLKWPGPPIPYRRQQEVLANYIGSLNADRLILTGDFNLSPWTFGMRRQDKALQPLTRVTRALPTWPAYVPRFYVRHPFQFLAIDHVYVGPGLRTIAVARQRRAASDHYPVLVQVEAR